MSWFFIGPFDLVVFISSTVVSTIHEMYDYECMTLNELNIMLVSLIISLIIFNIFDLHFKIN